MKVLMLLNQADNLIWDRYSPQIIPISDKIDMTILFHFSKNFNEYQKNIDIKQIHYNEPVISKNIYINALLRRLKIRSFYMHYIRGIEMLKCIKENKIDPDLIYGLSSSGYFQYTHLQVANKLNIPTIYRFRGLGIEARKYQLTYSKRKLNDTIDIHTSKKYDRYIPINKQFRNILINRGIDKNKISNPIFNGVDTDKFIFTHYPDEYTLGCCSRISYEKGINFLLEIMHKTPNIKYLYIGRKVIDVDFPDNCEYLGVWKSKNMHKFYNRCSAILLPSYSEGISNVFLESYACGRVVIASDKAYKKDIRNYGYVLPHNIEKWIKLIYYLKDNYDELKKSGQLAIEYAKENTWDIFAKKMIKEFKVVLE